MGQVVKLFPSTPGTDATVAILKAVRATSGVKAAMVAAELKTSVNAVLLAKSRVLSRLRQEMQGLTD